MRIIEPYIEIKPFDGLKIVKNLEEIGRVAYKSEDKINYEKFKLNYTPREG